MYDYDRQIAKLTENPQQIQIDWSIGEGLFKFVEPQDKMFYEHSGCLTMIRDRPQLSKAYTNSGVDEKLTLEIASDERIPKYNNDITVESLPVFKEWQEKIDKLLEQK